MNISACLASLVGVLMMPFLTSGCGSSRPVDGRIHHMGERVQVGPLIYNVLEAEWKNEMGQKTPTHRFLVLRLTITNSGGREARPPLLTIVHTSGAEHTELSEVEGLQDWLGLLRRLDPAATEDGRIVFDVASGAYKLRLSDGGEPGQENTAIVEIPLQLETPTPTSER